MDLKTRAALVREVRCEMKRSYRQPRAGESMQRYIGSTAEGGDQSYYDASERWDRARLRLHPRKRRHVPRAPRNEPYVGYPGLRGDKR